MQLASSIYLGGQLVSAEDANYESYKELGLICPSCKSAVFFQKSYIRNAGSLLETKVRSQFKHFKAIDATLVKLCEARVAKYNQKEINKQVAKAKNQRLRTFQNYFWKLFEMHYQKEMNFPVSEILEWTVPTELEERYQPKNIGNVLTNLFYSSNKEDSQLLAKQFIDAGFNGEHIIVCINPAGNGVSISSQVQFDFISKMRNKLDKDLQNQIVLEVIDFFYSKNSRPLVTKMFTLAAWVLLDSIADGSEFGFVGTTSFGNRHINFEFWDNVENKVLFYCYAHAHIIMWFSLLPWSNVFSKMSKQLN